MPGRVRHAVLGMNEADARAIARASVRSFSTLIRAERRANQSVSARLSARAGRAGRSGMMMKNPATQAEPAKTAAHR